SLCLCSSLQSMGVDVNLVVTEDRSENTRIPVNFSLQKWSHSKDGTYNKGLKAVKYIRYLSKLSESIIKNKADVVHFQFLRRERVESLYFLLLRILGMNLVYTAHDVLPHEKKKVDFLFKYIVYKAAKMIIAHSEHTKNMLVNEFHVAGEKIKIVPHG